MFKILKQNDIFDLSRRADNALKQLYSTVDGKAFFKELQVKYIDRTCICESERETLIKIIKKEIAEDLILRATGQSYIYIEEPELDE